MGLRLPPVILFDDGLGRFGPLTDLRASFELRTGALTMAERWPGAAALWARPEHRALVASRHAAPVNAFPKDGDEFALLNGRLADPALDGCAAIAEGPPTVVVEARSGHVVAARLSRAAAMRFLESGEPPPGVRRVEAEGMQLLARPWEILDPASHARRIELDIRERSGSLKPISSRAGVTVIGSQGASAHPDAKILPGVILDAELGPVAIDAGAVIRPGAVLVGPCFVGAGTIVAERALLKARTVFGPQCRAAGEVGSSVFQGFSNKAHDGHLGDSLVGEWVNLGAGTTNSNLLNTYGEVTLRLESDAPIERTGRQFVGAIIGDHVKTAILTRLTTGCVLGTGSMIAVSAFAPALVERFSWLTDEGCRLYRCDKFLEVARAAWSRRGVTPGEAMIDSLRALHARAAARHSEKGGAGGAARG